MRTYKDYLLLIANVSSHSGLMEIFIEMGNSKEQKEISNLEWWGLYSLISPKLTRAFKQTEAGKQMLAALKGSPRQVLRSVKQDAVTTMRRTEQCINQSA